LARADVSEGSLVKAAAVRALLRQRAVQSGLVDEFADSAGIDGAIEELLEQEVKTPELPTEDECLRFYQDNLKKFRSGDIVYVRHILCAITPGAPLELLRHKAEPTLHDLMHERERFAELAREYSN